MPTPATREELLTELETVRSELAQADEALRAISSGAVDALVVPSDKGEQIFTLSTADKPYRVLLEDMSEGALTMTPEGLLLFANQRFAEMVGVPLQKVIGAPLATWINPKNQVFLQSLIASEEEGRRRVQMELTSAAGTLVPVYVSVSKLRIGEGGEIICLVATDLTEHMHTVAVQAAKQASDAALLAAGALQNSLEESLKAISNTVEARDPYTAGHQRRVSELASAIARKMHLPDATVHGIGLAANVHDLGKLSIPTEILTKPGKLSAVELLLIRTHAQAGYDIIKNIWFPWPIATAVLQHHERLDGSGYPQGIGGDQLLIEGRIIAVADVVESMSSHRPYRAQLGIPVALEEIRKGSGTLFDTAVVDACIELFEQGEFKFSN